TVSPASRGSPFDLQPDLAVPGMGVSVERGRVVDIAVQRGGFRHRQICSDPKPCPSASIIRGERYKAGGGGELGRRLAKKFVQEVGTPPNGKLARRFGRAFFVDQPVACQSQAD